MRKLDYGKQIGESQAQHVGGGNARKHETSSTQSVKLRKYTITPFLVITRIGCVWNQFTEEVDGSSISKISKLNYLLELVKGKPKDDILGLPQTEDGYNEAKRILEQTYGKDIKVHKALIKELEELPAISSIHRLNSPTRLLQQALQDSTNTHYDEGINYSTKLSIHSNGQAGPSSGSARSKR